eukprot:179215-Prorocentrum_minimum.AAC.1
MAFAYSVFSRQDSTDCIGIVMLPAAQARGGVLGPPLDPLLALFGRLAGVAPDPLPLPALAFFLWARSQLGSQSKGSVVPADALLADPNHQ